MYDINSTQNKRLKQVLRLKQRRQRDEARLVVAEGVREIGLALQSGFVPTEAYYCPDLIQNPAASKIVAQLEDLSQRRLTQLFTVSTAVYAKMAYRAESGGLLLLIPYWQQTLNDLSLNDNPFLVVVDGAEKPGNLGAILRTADAAGIDGLIVTTDGGSATDLFNPNVVRASLGALFTVPIVTSSSDETIAWLKAHEIALVATTPAVATLYTAVNLTRPTAIVMGSEAQGLSENWLQAADHQVRIPMAGIIDSLNLSTATALLLYEVVRQRIGGS